MEQREPIYSTLPFFKRIVIKSKAKFSEFKKNFKFPWIKLIVFVLVVAIIVAVFAIVLANGKTFPTKPAYDKTGFIDIEDFTDQTITFENDNYQFTLDSQTTQFTLLDKNNNKTWSSNPDGRNTDTLVLYYPKSLGVANSIGTYSHSVNYEGTKNYAFRVTEDAVEVLYTVGGKVKIDYTDFPLKIDKARFEEVIIKATEDEIARRQASGESYSELRTALTTVTSLYITSSDIDYYTADSAKMQVERILNRLYLVFYEVCGYTEEDLAMDNALNEVENDKSYPKFEVSIKYTLTDGGLDVLLNNDAIVDYESEPLIYIDVLPYFGCATLSDFGYSLIPDGSGVIIDFNNSRSYASPYSQRIYGEDFGVNNLYASTNATQISLGVYGMNVNNNGFINIVQDGAEACAIHSNNSSTANPYNQTYYRFYYRESDLFSFSSIANTSTITQWTNDYNNTNLELIIRGVKGDGSYPEMASSYQEFLVEEGKLIPNDNTTSVMLNLELLGGYLSNENFIGFKYTTPRSLTTANEVREIVEELLGLEITSLNVIYQGWSNSGIKSTYMGKLRYNNVIASRNDLKSLQEYFNSISVDLYPTASVAQAYTDKDFSTSRDAIRNVFGEVTSRYDDSEALFIQNATTTPKYTLKSSTYDKTLTNLLKNYNSIGFKNIGFNDFGNISYGSYESSNMIFKNQVVTDYLNSMEKYQQSFNNVVTYSPFDYALKYTNVALNIPTFGTNYQIVQSSVPFYQLVISGYIDYSGESFNLEDQHSFDYYKMKAIETGSNIAMTWTYDDTIDLIKTEYNSYYSTNYKNWIEETVKVYQELNSLKVYQSYLSSHQLLTVNGSVTKSSYGNGMEIVFNYSNIDYVYNGIVIPSNTYKVVKEA